MPEIARKNLAIFLFFLKNMLDKSAGMVYNGGAPAAAAPQIFYYTIPLGFLSSVFSKKIKQKRSRNFVQFYLENF